MKYNRQWHAHLHAAQIRSEGLLSKFVTGFEKTLLVGFFVKIEFDASLISSTIELTHLQVLG